MDRAYEDNETRQLALDFGFIPVVPPKSNRLEPWQYDKALYRKRNEVERLFRRLKGFRRIFSRFDKLDVLFLGFLNFALTARGRTHKNSGAVTKHATTEISDESFANRRGPPPDRQIGHSGAQKP